ncbi:MAG: hypothetical protein ACLQVI_39725 [Polyangiaceae bacterium]
MPAHSQGFRSEALTRALDVAIGGDARALYDLLARMGGLPGPRVNSGVVLAFANECAARGTKADALVAKMATLDVDAAPGASKYEILPVCGVAALGARAASDAAAMRALATLHDCAEDLRFRVRDGVADALARIGEVRGEPLVHDLASWMDGYFHAAAVLRALADPRWLTRIKSASAVVERLDEGFELAKNAPRATARYPGFKALIDALTVAPVEAAARFGVPVFELLARWSASKDPTLRDVVSKVLDAPKLAGRFAEEVTRTKAALVATEAPRRDPRTYVGPTRGRGRKR